MTKCLVLHRLLHQYLSKGHKLKHLEYKASITAPVMARHAGTQSINPRCVTKFSLQVRSLPKVLASDGVMDLGARGGCKEQDEDMGHAAHPLKAMSQG